MITMQQGNVCSKILFVKISKTDESVNSLNFKRKFYRPFRYAYKTKTANEGGKCLHQVWQKQPITLNICSQKHAHSIVAPDFSFSGQQICIQ